MKEILVMNRRDAIKKSYEISKENKTYAIISISEYKDTFPQFHKSEQLLFTIYLSFDDVDKTSDEYYAMDLNDALRIASFLKKQESSFDTLIVHCLAGRSRSAGVAAAIAKWKWNDDSFYFKRYCPNMNCYTLLLNMLMNNKF